MTQNTPTWPSGDEPRVPVFVDESGRRRRRLRVLGWVLGLLAVVYVSLFAVSLLSSPSLLPLTLPGIGRLLPNAGAPDIKVPGHGRQRAATVIATASPRPATTSARASATAAPAPVRTPSARPTPALTAPPASARPHPTGKPTAIPSAAPSTKPTAHGSPSTHPTPRGTGRPTTKPSSSHRRSPTAHPHLGRP